ncbi:MAG: ACT domain-containing protein [Coriobacteriales bacterium]|nr:ACT domain-containing protein [Coriobacteriales bacterium]
MVKHEAHDTGGSDMGIIQISVFVENQPGRVNRLTDILEKADVSIRGFSLADTADFGIARFVLDKPEVALEAFREADVLTKTTELLCIELPDRPGSLGHVFAAVAAAGINVEYAYSLVSSFVVLKVGDIQQAEQLLGEQPVRLVAPDELRQPLAKG